MVMEEECIGSWPSFICLSLSQSDASKVEALAKSCIKSFLDGVDRGSGSSSVAVDNREMSLPSQVGTKRRASDECRVSVDTNNSTTFVALERSQLHVSLSKHFALRRHHIVPFIERLGQSLASIFHSKLSVALDCDQTTVLHNDDKSRSYLALTIGDHHHDGMLLKMLHAIDGVVNAFNGPGYYEPPIFHVSLGYLPYDENLRVATAKRMKEESSAAAGATSASGDDAARGALYASRYCCFEDDDDDVEEEMTGACGGAKSDKTAVVATDSAVVTFGTVECHIGDKQFRLSAGQGKNAFVEVNSSLK